MDDIISKLSVKDRKHQITVKKKFIDEALTDLASTNPDRRASQVYVIVINREKDYDPIISQKLAGPKRFGSNRNAGSLPPR